MKRNLLVVTLLVAFAASAFGPAVSGTAHAATTTQTHTQIHAQAFDKTKFVLHLGAAYFAFHHWVYKPYKAGKLSRHHLITVAKAAIALLFAYHEVKTAYNLAKGSNSKTLQLIISPMSKLASGFNSLRNKFKHGQINGGDVTALGSQADGFQKLAGSKGFGFSDHQMAVPGL